MKFLFSLSMGLMFSVLAFGEITITDTGPDFGVPVQLWEKIDVHRGEKSLEFMPIKIEIEEKNPGVLRESEFVFQYSKGGGVLDLGLYTTDKRGTFFLKVELPESMMGDELKVFYISKARKRRLESDVWGAGCSKAFEITKFFRKTMNDDGLELNTTRARHLTVIGGTLIFSFKNQITQLTVTDSGQPEYFCSAEPKKEE